MNTLPKISQKRSSHSPLPIDIEKLKKGKKQEAPLSKINWNLLKYCNPERLTQHQINIYKLYLKVIKDEAIDFPPFLIFENKPSDLNAEASYFSVTNTISYYLSNNAKSAKSHESTLKHELNHYKDHMKMSFVILLSDSNSPLIKENDKKFIDFYKKNIIELRNIHPDAKVINSKINRKVKKYLDYPIEQQKNIVEEGLLHLKDVYSKINIRRFLIIISNPQKKDFEFKNNDEKLYAVKEVLEYFKASTATNDNEKKIIEKILNKINSITKSPHNLRQAKKSILHLENEERQQLNKSLNQYCNLGILTEQKSYMISEKTLNSNIMINSAYLNKYYFGKNIIQIQIYEPLYRQYDAYVNKKQLKHAPFITMTPNIPNNMHINSDNTVLLDSRAIIDERVFDLILKTHVLKMMVKHNKLPNFNDNNIPLYRYINSNFDQKAKLSDDLLQKNEQHLKDLEDEYNENGPAIRTLKKAVLNELFYNFLVVKEPKNEEMQVAKSLILSKMLTNLSKDFGDIDEDKKTEIGKIIESLKKFYADQLLPEPPKIPELSDEQYDLLTKIQKDPDHYFNL